MAASSSQRRLHPYPPAVDLAFYGRVDYAVLNKTYDVGLPTVDGKRRYGPPACVKATQQVIFGSPYMHDVSTSLVERANLSIRIGSPMRSARRRRTMTITR